MSKGKGVAELKKYRRGVRLTASASILAMCASCMGEYDAGEKMDCGAEDCPLYGFMPYSSKPRIKSRRGKKAEEEEL